MSLLSELGAYLVASTSLGLSYSTAATGATLYLTPFPEYAPDSAVSLIQYAGREPERAFTASTSAPNIVTEYQRVQINMRNALASFSTLDALATSVYAYVDQPGTITLSGSRYLAIKPIQPPFYLEEDGNGRHHYVFNVECWRERI